MKRIIRMLPSVLLVLILSFGIIGCQSSAQTVPETVPPAEEPVKEQAGTAEAGIPEEAVAENGPETIIYTLAGYELTFVIGG